MANAYSSPQRGQVDPAGPSFGPGAIVTGAVVVAGLYFGREVLVPFVVAVLLSFVLAIPARALQTLGLGRTVPVAVVVLVAFLIIGAVSALLVTQAADLANDLPRYQTTIRAKIAAIKGATSGAGPLEKLGDLIQNLSEDLAPAPAPDRPATPGEAAPERPLPVEVAATRSSPIATLAAYLGAVVHPLATAGLVVVFTVFILLQRGDLRNRAIRLAGSQDLQRTTAAMNDAAERLSRFFLVQVLINSAFGVVVGIGLWAIGVPSPMLWGVLATISRFVPYVGVALAAGGPLLLAASVDPHWTMLAFTAGFFLCAEFFVAQIVEPLVYGHSTGLTPVAVVASVTFWAWLWGPAGLILATPLTVCLVVLGRHVERLEFLDVMLGDRPPLTVAEVFYQRVLAGDAGETLEQAETFLRGHRLATYYDEVAVKGLALGQIDVSRGTLDPGALARIQESCGQLIEELADHEDAGSQAGAKEGSAPAADIKRAAGDHDLDRSIAVADEAAAALPVLRPGDLAPGWEGRPVLCIAGRNELDRMGAAMLAHILTRQGLGAAVAPSESLSRSGAETLDPETTRVVCLSFLDTSSPVRVRYAVRRVRRQLPDARVIVGSWGLASSDAEALCETAVSDGCVTRLTEAARLCLETALAAGEPQGAHAPGDGSAALPASAAA